MAITMPAAIKRSSTPPFQNAVMQNRGGPFFPAALPDRDPETKESSWHPEPGW
jgi:hypothetical protein